MYQATVLVVVRGNPEHCMAVMYSIAAAGLCRNIVLVVFEVDRPVKTFRPPTDDGWCNYTTIILTFVAMI